MSYFLAKTDPETYSIENLAQEGQTVWDGVRNAQALQAIRTMRPGDQVFIYHSQGVAAVVGLAEVVSEPRPDPQEPKSWVIDLKFVQKLTQPVSLKEIKETGQFEGWNLVRQSRLSTMTAPDEFVQWLKGKNVGF